jgi:uncharacterized protein with PIN domain
LTVATDDEDRGATKLKFLVDGMLGSLAVKLRMLGFDTLYDKESSDAQLMKIAKQSKRILLTSDMSLYSRSILSQVSCIALTKKDDASRLIELLKQLNISTLDASVKSRCSICNGSLVEDLPDEFGRARYRCVACKKKYWRGSHWNNLEKLVETVNRSVSNG